MSTDRLFIPPRLRVGFQKREDTYTKQLGYVIYYDLAGKLRKEASWEGWRSKEIPPVEHDNAPTEGFVLNRDGGGGRGWDARRAFIRVWDPRGWEFEISLPNLLFILAEGTCSPGKGLEGRFVYAWEGKELVLLPCAARDYKESAAHTALQGRKVGARDLRPGATYLTKRQELWVFLGRLPYYWQLEEAAPADAPSSGDQARGDRMTPCQHEWEPTPDRSPCMYRCRACRCRGRRRWSGPSRGQITEERGARDCLALSEPVAVGRGEHGARLSEDDWRVNRGPAAHRAGRQDRALKV